MELLLQQKRINEGSCDYTMVIPNFYQFTKDKKAGKCQTFSTFYYIAKGLAFRLFYSYFIILNE